jgi:hypothetical protein
VAIIEEQENGHKCQEGLCHRANFFAKFPISSASFAAFTEKIDCLEIMFRKDHQLWGSAVLDFLMSHRFTSANGQEVFQSIGEWRYQAGHRIVLFSFIYSFLFSIPIVSKIWGLVSINRT